MLKVSPINFKAIYYIKNTGNTKDFAYKSIGDLKAAEFIHDNSPSQEIKNIVENSDFFQKLGKDTDVFISSSIEKVNNSFNSKNNTLGTIIAAFNDPYVTTKKIAAEMFIIKTGNSKQDVYNKIKTVVNKINDYQDLTSHVEKTNNNIHFIKGDAYITFGEY